MVNEIKLFVLVACLQVGTFLNLSKKVGRNCVSFSLLCMLPHLRSGWLPVSVTTLAGWHHVPACPPSSLQGIAVLLVSQEGACLQRALDPLPRFQWFPSSPVAL